MIIGWHYYYRLYFGWIPIQFCFVCGKTYWGGLPRWNLSKHTFDKELVGVVPIKHWWNYKIVLTWEASWMDYCSQKCCDNDPTVPPPDSQYIQRKQEESKL